MQNDLNFIPQYHVWKDGIPKGSWRPIKNSEEAKKECEHLLRLGEVVEVHKDEVYDYKKDEPSGEMFAICFVLIFGGMFLMWYGINLISKGGYFLIKDGGYLVEITGFIMINLAFKIKRNS